MPQSRGIHAAVAFVLGATCVPLVKSSLVPTSSTSFMAATANLSVARANVMTYSLYFWRESRALSISADDICSALCEDSAVDGIAVLPIDAIRQAFVEAFPGMDDGLSSLSWEGDGSHFEVHWPPDPPNMLTVSCGYELLKSPDTMNRIIDVVSRFGCALYDPQTGERYQQPDLQS